VPAVERAGRKQLPAFPPDGPGTDFAELLYDCSQTTVATDHVDAEYVAAPRRWDIANIGRYMICLGPVSSLFG
jgi:hypothetical protein